jgi:hypothetical protein
MSYIKKEDEEQILNRTASKLAEVIGEFQTLHRKGSHSFACDCPICGGRNKLEINTVKLVFKCFSCNGLAGKRPVDYLMRAQNMTYPDALRYLATHIGYFIEEDKPAAKPAKKAGKEKSFCAQMLAASGLTEEDVTANVFRANEKEAAFKFKTFKKGTLNSFGEIDLSGDDMLIEYYDLVGLPVMYELLDKNRRPTGKRREYLRVRWKFPEEHPDKDGKPTKYKTPYGGGTHIYIPERIRKAYKSKEKIERLFIQEGEKKAEKACKHGLLSIAISGIQNIGQQGKLPEDLIRIISTCEVKEVCLLLDSDWNDISNNIRINDNVEKRPRNFFYAIRNFKDYCRSLKSRDIYIEIFFGHVNSKKDKGIDDLLNNTLKGQEDLLLKDLEKLTNDKNFTGKYLTLYKITSATDHKLEEYWYLNHPAQFAEAHRDVLKNLPEFRIGKHIWKFTEDGEFVSAQPIELDEQFWNENERTDRSGNSYIVYSFNYARCFRFLQNRGFGRYRRIDNQTILIHVEPPTVLPVEANDIRDFLTDFTKSVCNEEVLNMIYKGGPQYLGPDKLSNLNFITPNFEVSSRDKQMFFFQDSIWEITREKITELDYTKVQMHIWGDRKKPFVVKKTADLIKIHRDEDTGRFTYTVTETGKACNFLQFLINTSNFTWRRQQLADSDTAGYAVTDEDIYDNIEHLIAKLCAIGYMLMDAKDRSVSRAVVAMDGKQSEVGASNGRSGKSIVGEMFKLLMPTFYINGKTKDIQGDAFIWNDLIEGMRCCFVDDVRPNFDFEFLFANITGDWNVNYKGGGRATFPFNVSPKIYLTTNHALNGDGSSFTDRQWLLAFSDFYNDKHKPIHDFGTLFFDEWDGTQWNLHWNLMAECVRAYLRFGVIESPKERLSVRRLRQEVGETFILWADEYFSSDEHLNARLSRRILYDNFLEYSQTGKKFCSPVSFKRKVVKYCELKGYVFNPHRYDPISNTPLYFDKDGNPDIDDKSNGVEYFTVGKKIKEVKHPSQQELEFPELPDLTEEGLWSD